MSQSRTDLCDFRSDGVEGAASGPAYLTRCGVFSYTQADGTVTNELRHPSEVFARDSLASLRACPIVAGHPAMIDSSNWKQYSLGHVGDDVCADGAFVAATLHLQDATALAHTQGSNPKFVELSCGYSCEVASESGTYDGVPYDSRQFAIRYNHVGLGPEGWGRAGSSVRLYWDSKDAAPVQHAQGCYKEESTMKKFTPLARVDGGETPAAPAPPPAPGETPPPPLETPDVPQAPVHVDSFDAMRGRIAALEAENATLQAARADGQARSNARARVALLQAAQALGLDAAHVDSLTDDGIRCAVLAKVSPSLKTDGESSEYVRAAFDLAQRSDANTRKALLGGAAPEGAHTGLEYIGSRVDAARADGIEKSKNSWKVKV